ncbi:MAG TPA: lyase family protein, partial [Casimicrobiaceae bacterium]|nr:lyase family protein [Casimicrobiaceae bacterium]
MAIPTSKRRNKSRPWSARFAEPVDALTQRFTASLAFDRRLAAQDIAGSLAHARMLAACGVISARDGAAIERGLGKVRAEIASGKFDWSAGDEDVHSAIERRLTELVGEAGKRLHTARSRNDQVATDL